MPPTPASIPMQVLFQAMASVFLCLLFWTLQRPLRGQRFVLWWAIAWSAFAVHLLCGLGAILSPPWSTARNAFMVASVVMGYLQFPALVLGTWAYRLDPRAPRLARHWLFLLGSVLLGIGVAAFSLRFRRDPGLAFAIRSLPRLLLMAGAYGYCAWVFGQALRRRWSWSAAITALACAGLVLVEARLVGHGVNVVLVQAWGLPVALPWAEGHQGLFWAFLQSTAELALALGMVRLLVEGAQADTERLRLSEAKFSAAFKASPDALAITSLEDGLYLQVSHGYLRIFGWSEAEALGRTALELGIWVRAEDRARFVASVRAMGEVSDVEVDMRRKDGTAMVAQASARMLEIEGVPRMLSIIRDITARKELERSLQKASLAMEQSPLTIIITDREGRIEYVNPGFTATSGYSAAEALGRNPRFLKSGETPPDTHADLWATITEGRTWEGTLVNRRKDGGLFWERAKISPIREGQGRITHFLAQKEDITSLREAGEERRRLERQVQQSQRMEAVGQLAGGIAHDINNMLAVMEAHLDLLRGELPPGSRALDRIAAMADAAARSGEIVGQILAFSRRQVNEPAVLDLNARLQESRRTLGPLLGEDVELHLDEGADLWHVKFDPAQLEQIVVNLVVNARDAMAAGGRIRIQTGNAVIDEAYCAARPEARPGEYVCLAVSDQGSGMSPEVQARIFEPFYSTKPMGQGTGLGLPTVLGIVQQGGGFVNVYSEPGLGSTFQVHLPACFGEVPAARPAAAASTPMGAGAVLLVEDNELLREAMEEVIGRLGYRVRAAESPAQALEFLADPAVPVDLLLTDVIMPAMNGKELRDRALELRPALRVLFMSGYTADVIGRQGILADGVNFIQKPFSTAAIANKLAQILGGAG